VCNFRFVQVSDRAERLIACGRHCALVDRHCRVSRDGGGVEANGSRQSGVGDNRVVGSVLMLVCSMLGWELGTYR
jgi:hypothetical protein